MEKNNVIKELMIGGNQIDKKTSVLVGDILKKNTTLKKLGLRNSGLDASGLIAIGGALEVNDQLEFLDLAGNDKITKKEAIAQWAGTFQKNISLVELNLAATGLDKSTIPTLFANLKYNNKLEV
jgi:Ran GTPase-activating protein (RanGAP) involved in mRNA processing and transport